MKTDLNSLRKIILVASVVFWLVATGGWLYAITSPNYSWDSISYVALIGGPASETSDARHDRAFTEFGRVVTAEQYGAQVGFSPYTQLMATNTRQFDSQLPMYKVKAGYISTGRALSGWLTPYQALRLINIIALVLLSAVGLWWMVKGGFIQGSFAIVPALNLAGISDALKLSTPDILESAILLLAIAVLQSGRIIFGALIFAAATYVRPDAIFLGLGCWAAALLLGHELKNASLVLAASFAGYAAATLGINYPGWWYHVSMALYGADAVLHPVPFTLFGYFSKIASRMLGIVILSGWASFVGLAGLLWIALIPQRNPVSSANVLFLGCFLSLGGRLLGFPMTENRIYLPTMIIMTFLVAERWKPNLEPALSAMWSGRPAWLK
jgi:hypothetical protein